MVTGALLTAAAIGAGTGAGVAALTGGDPLKGALFGAAGGAIGGAFAGGAAGGLSATGGAIVGGAVGASAGSIISPQKIPKVGEPRAAGNVTKTATALPQLSETARRNRRFAGQNVVRGFAPPKLGRAGLLGLSVN